jgi:hypothetical protein
MIMPLLHVATKESLGLGGGVEEPPHQVVDLKE